LRDSDRPRLSGGYDQAGNLTSVSRPKFGELPTLADSYGYDGDGMRSSQTISGSTSHMSWDAAEGLLLLSDGTSSFIYGPGGLPIEQIAGETAQYLHHDQQGSTRMLTGGSGTVLASTTFDAYGNKLGSTGSATTALGYDRQYTSADNGLIYLRARTYDPTTAQFLTVDPLLMLTGEPYGYAGSNPLANGDPAGLSFWSTLGQVVSVGTVCLLTEGGACLVAGLSDLDANVVSNDIHAVVEPCSASIEEERTFSEVLGFAAGAGVGQLAGLTPEIEAALGASMVESSPACS
jgi:RHS repeat-associated protein